MALSQQVTDDFNRVNGDPGANWIHPTLTELAIVSNKLSHSADPGDAPDPCCHTGMSGIDDGKAVFAMGGTTAFAAIVARVTDATLRVDNASNNCYFVTPHSNGNFHLYKYVAGSLSLLGSGSWSSQEGVFSLECIGTTIKGFEGETEHVSVTDSSVTGQEWGAMPWGTIGANTMTWDDFEGWYEPAATPVNSDMQAVWNVRATVSSDMQAVWAVRKTIESDMQAVWNVATVLGKDRLFADRVMRRTFRSGRAKYL